MQPENAIEVKDLTKKFKVYIDKGSQLKERILFWKRNRYEERWVLNGISFRVRKGEAIGLIGHNGCGKSTTLKLLTKIIYPDSGTIEMRGRVSSLIELGAGFHPDMSGRENIYTNASIFGLSKKEIDERVEDIIAFSELEEFIDNPVRTYSSGMYMRLAFSVAINVDADILLIDEILAVGDAHFQEKCFHKMQDIKKSGTTIVIVSHSLGQIEEICDRSIWIDAGKIRLEGRPEEVHEKYLEHMGVKTAEQKKKEIRQEQEREKEKQKKEKAEEEKLTTLRFAIKNIRYIDETKTVHNLYQSGERGRLELVYDVENVCEHAEMSIDLREDEWVTVAGTNLKTIPVNRFETEIKQGQLLTSLTEVGRQNENYLTKMQYNGNCEWLEDRLLIHDNGVMYGPYITMPPMQYRLYVDVAFEGEGTPVLAVTKESGNVRLGEMRLKSGSNMMSLFLEEKAEKLEFVLSNATGEDIVVKRITLL
ncbi:MAG: ABC transporter ATP-binding protein [Clostridiales bacterium]|nr:ABC transporter ATP-binding protein [Clostridiales bacterium]